MSTTIGVNLQTEFDKQIEDFAKDESYFADYARYTPRKDKVLVKLFKFTMDDVPVGSTTILMPSQLPSERGQWKPSVVTTNEKVYPIVKVIKVGKDVKDVKVGQMYVVPHADIIGDSFNPEFMFLMNNFVKQGKKMGLADVPEDMEQRISNLEKNWERYKFSMPDRVGSETSTDKLIYLIPELKLEADYELNQ